MPSKIRKQVYELSVTDFERHPVWEFALDEEGEEGQDEATVRPFDSNEALDPGAGMFVVRAEFTLADGTILPGYLTPGVQGDRSMGTIQPIVLTPQGQVFFWYGVIPLAADRLRQCYAKIGRQSGAVFPCRFKSTVELAGGPVAGTLGGFQHYRSFKDQTVVEVR